MDAETIITWLETVVPASTGERLSELERVIIQQVWLGQKYLEIAKHYGCTEGHAKDVGSRLWKLLSKVLKQKINKSNCRRILEKVVRKTGTITNLWDFTASQPIPKVVPPENTSDDITPTQTYNPTFLGRDRAISQINSLHHQGAKVIVIQGEGGLGKTTLGQQYLQTQGFDLVLELLMGKETANITPAEYVVEEWLKQDFQEEPGIEFGVSLARLKRKLRSQRIGILIDNFEPILDRHGKIIPAHGNYREILRILADGQVNSVTLITSRDRVCEPEFHLEHYRLPGLEESAWLSFFQARKLDIHPETLTAMHRTYGGNAKAMGILYGCIREDFDGDMAAYWQHNQDNPLAIADLQNLVVSQINRIASLDMQAYCLLCRMGCYRYQDVPRIPKAGLTALLWDVPASQHEVAIASLRNRSLVEYHQGEYWLHPLIRTEMISRLRQSSEWEKTNHRAAEFWLASITKIITFKDAIIALEAYYHYLEIDEFELAAQVILKSRHNLWGQYLPLGSVLYRMGWLQPLIAAINQVIPHLHHNQFCSELYNILGDLYWIIGQVNTAINCQEKARNIAINSFTNISDNQQNISAETKHQIYYFKMLEVDSLLSLGLYNIDLWELEIASNKFQQVINLASNTEHHRWAEKASVCLALVKSFQGDFHLATQLADKAYTSITNPDSCEQPERIAYFIQILAQTYLNLQRPTPAEELSQIVLKAATASYYLQVQAKTLNCVAGIYAQKNDFNQAITNYEQARDILEQIGAKCDLATTLINLGLIYQQTNQLKLTQTYLARAMELFAEIQAPKQVQRIQLLGTGDRGQVTGDRRQARGKGQ